MEIQRIMLDYQLVSFYCEFEVNKRFFLDLHTIKTTKKTAKESFAECEPYYVMAEIDTKNKKKKKLFLTGNKRI
jgi:hypothetical protein